MPEINSSFRFSWEPATWGQSFKALFRTPSPGPTWFQDLIAFDMVSFTKQREEGSPRKTENKIDQPFEKSCNIVHKSVAYLAKYSHPSLEQALERKFNELSTAEEFKNAFHSILLSSLKTSRPNMLEVCQRILSSHKLAKVFGVSDVIAKAREEAEYVPKPEPFFVSLIKSTSVIVQFPLQRIRKIFSYIYSMTARAYVPDDINRPPDTIQRAQGTWSFYRDAIYDGIFVVQITKRLLTMRWKTGLVGVGLLVSFGVVLYKFSEAIPSASRFKVLLPEQFHGSRDVGECYSPPSPIKREPSASLEAHLHALKQRLLDFEQDKEITLHKCKIERQSNPEWMNTDKGKILKEEKKNIDYKITEQKKKIETGHKLCKRLDILAHLYFHNYQQENRLLHLLIERGEKLGKSLENTKKVFLFLKYLALPEIKDEFDAIKSKFQTMLMPPDITGMKIYRARSTSALEGTSQQNRASPAAISYPLPTVLQAIESLTLPPPAVVIGTPTYTLTKRRSSSALPASS